MLCFKTLDALRRTPKMLALLRKHAEDSQPVNVSDEFHQTRKALLRHGLIAAGGSNAAHKGRPRITVLAPAGKAALLHLGTG